MKDRILIGLGRLMIPIPRLVWQALISKNVRDVEADLKFMSEDHHQVRDFVVRELPRSGEPLSSAFIARALKMPGDRVTAVLDELEKRLMFLFRNEQGAVTWAYPVTVDKTPHQATFSTGEQLSSA